jgi:hypothetical protein
MMIVAPALLWAQEPEAAMLHDPGGVFLNGTPAPASSAVFPNDVLQTQAQSEATLDANGTTVAIKSDTVVQFQGNQLDLDHGTLLVSSSRGMRVRVGCITVIPATTQWTQYDVIDVDGRVRVAAHKNDVNIDRRGMVPPQKAPEGASLRNVVREGEEKIYEEKCAAPGQKAPYSARGAILNSPWAKAGGRVLVGVPTCWALCWRDDDPVSPYRP